MTKMKNTKKGMAKKALSISLIAAMLATSNVPVWAAFDAEDPADVAVEAQVFDAAEPVVDEVAPAAEPTVVNEVSDSGIETYAANDEFDLTYVRLADDLKLDWDSVTKNNKGNLLFKDGSIITDEDGNNVTNTLKYVWVYNNSAWDASGASQIGGSDLNSDGALTLNLADLKAHVGQSLSLIFTTASGEYVNRFELGTILPVDIADTGVSCSISANPIYDGSEKKVTPTVTGSTDTSTYTDNFTDVGAFNWYYNGDTINAGSTITVSGTPVLGGAYTGTISVTYQVEKATLSNSNVTVKVVNKDKKFTYTGNVEESVGNAEALVTLTGGKNAAGEQADISLGDFVKDVTVDASSVSSVAGTADKNLSAILDAVKINASQNFKTANPNTDKEITAVSTGDQVEVTALNLADVNAVMTNSVKAGSISSSDLSAATFKFTLKSDSSKELDLTGDYTASIVTKNYTAGNYPGVITLNAAAGNVNIIGTTTANLVVTENVFNQPDFANGVNGRTEYLALTEAAAKNLTSTLPYKGGAAVEFSDIFKSTGTLGSFYPDKNNALAGEVTAFTATYENNNNAGIGKLTVVGKPGTNYAGSTAVYYFKIAASNVEADSDASKSTVTTKVTAADNGVEIKDTYTEAGQYADAIGFQIKGTDDKTLDADKQIVSTATVSDFEEVEYSFVDGATASANVASNQVGNYIKATITLKENGNFQVGTIFNGGNAGTPKALANGVLAETVAASTGNNGVIALYVPIIDKAIDSNVEVTLDKDEFTYTGSIIDPKVTVKVGDKVLIKGTDYTVNIVNGIDAGTAKVIVTMKSSSGYRGSKSMDVLIKAADLNDIAFELQTTYTGNVYTGKAIKPAIVDTDATPAVNVGEADIKLGDNVLTDMFAIAYGDNVNAGKESGTVILTPKAAYAKNFTGSSVTKTFEIKKREITTGSNTADKILEVKDEDGKKITVTSGSPNTIDAKMSWTGEEITLDAKIVDGTLGTAAQPAPQPTLAKSDYAIEYANNIDATTAAQKAWLCIVGKGNFTGANSIVKDRNGNVSLMSTTDVEAANKANPGTYTTIKTDVVQAYAFVIGSGKFTAKGITVENAVYAGGLAVKPVVTVKDSDGKLLTEGTDYELDFDTSVVNATTDPVDLTVIGKGFYNGITINKTVDGKSLTFIIDKLDLEKADVAVNTQADGTLKAEVKVGPVTETKEEFVVVDNGDGTATVTSKDEKNFTGKSLVRIDQKEAAPVISVSAERNMINVAVDKVVEGASAYDFVLCESEEAFHALDFFKANKNTEGTASQFQFVRSGSYKVYARAITRDADGKKSYSDWSEAADIAISTDTPNAATINKVAVSGNKVTVTFTPGARTEGVDVMLGQILRSSNGEPQRPVTSNFTKYLKKNLNAASGKKQTVTFTGVAKGTHYIGVHPYITSNDGLKYFGRWSKQSTATKVVIK